MALGNDTFKVVFDELKQIKKDSSFPDHVVAQAAVVTNAAAEVATVAWQLKYNPPEKPEDLEVLRTQLKLKLIRTTAQAFRFIENL